MFSAIQRPALFRALLMLLSFASAHVHGTEAARMPLHDEVVETQLLPRGVKQSVQRLRSTSLSAGDVRAELPPAQRLDTARRLIQAGRASGDPRTLGYAEAALAGMADAGPAGVEALVLKATIEQSRHRFDAARTLLDRAIDQSPAHVQARLTRATIAYVRAEIDAARADCDALYQSSPTVALICNALGDSLSGHNVRALNALQKVSEPALRSWALSLAGDIHAQQGALQAAVSTYTASLALDADLYTAVALADALIAVERWPQAEALLAPLPATDAVLLRRWILTRRQQRDASAVQSLLADRFAAAQARGELLHAREAARFELERGDHQSALKLALKNWKDQREPADLLLLALAARNNHDSAALAQARGALARNRLQDVRIERALSGTP